ncbi:MAG: flagellar biosynthesis protein FlhF [Phycisphaeraceae bacterium]|nr:flagellar biosynthesis protein FlhF [Phycisphaeraceae bacterium]
MMTLKTYRGSTMAAALAEVKRDLGADAVILHTRSFKAGGVLGVGTKPIVEITASADADSGPGPGGRQPPRAAARAAPTPGPTPQQAPVARAAAVRDEFVPVRDWAGVGATQSAAPEPAPAPRAEPRKPTLPPAPRVPTTRAAIAPANESGRAAIEHELASIKRLLGHVLHATGRGVGAHANGAMPDALADLYLRLTDEQVAAELADRLIAAVRDRLPASALHDGERVRDALADEIAALVPVAPPIPAQATAGACRAIALVGPTGVGKTTTIAKLAAAAKLRHGLRAALITSDTYRIAAVEQLRTYAEIVGLPMRVALTPREMHAAREAFRDHDAVFIDTAGRSPRDEGRLRELAEFVRAAAPDETHLVLSAAAAEPVMMRAAERFAPLAPDRLILSKVDEAEVFGPAFNAVARLGLPLSYLTTGQEVPDDVEAAQGTTLARLVLEGRATTALAGAVA